MCIPVDSMLWALAARIRDEHYAATPDDMRALLGSGCTKARIREVLLQLEAGCQAGQGQWPPAPFSVALAALRELEEAE